MLRPQQQLEEEKDNIDTFRVLRFYQYPEAAALREYRCVDRLCDLQKGRFLRWFKQNGALSRGGVFVNLSFTDQGAVVLCKVLPQRSYVSFRFDQTLTFERLTPEEVLLATLK